MVANNASIRFFSARTMLLFSSIAVDGQNSDFWSDPTGGFYDSGLNWLDGSPAGNSDIAIFDLPDSYDVFWDDLSGDTSCHSVMVNAGEVTMRRLNGISIHEVMKS